VAAQRVHIRPEPVDTRFYRPQGGDREPYVLSVGAERRDYPTLLDAVRGLGARAVIVASSAWAGPQEVAAEGDDWVDVRRGVPYRELRDLYDRAAAVVVAVEPGADYGAGVNALQEGLAMARPVILTETPGLEGYLDDGQTGRLVPAGDPQALREVLAAVLSDDNGAARLGRQGREAVAAAASFDDYVDFMAALGGEISEMVQRAQG
jgi:glycosyltransferase involved in cell wall biosynthesis